MTGYNLNDNTITGRRRTKLRELLRAMPVEDVALVLHDQTSIWFDQVFETLIEMRDAEDGPQDDDHLNYGGETVDQAHERARKQREEI